MSDPRTPTFPNRAYSLTQLDELVEQFTAFTLRPTMVVPHYQVPTLPWIGSSRGAFNAMVRDLCQPAPRVREAFAYWESGPGNRGVAVYADHGNQWNKSLVDPAGHEKAHNVYHEMGHMLVEVRNAVVEGNKQELTMAENEHYQEQVAIHAGAAIQTAVGVGYNQNVKTFPYGPSYWPSQRPLLNPAVDPYNPAPLTRHYLTPQGQAEGAARFRHPNNIVRFDLIGDEVASQGLAYRLHYAAMSLFGRIAIDLSDPTYSDYVVNAVPGLRATLPHGVPQDIYAAAVLKGWWNNNVLRAGRHIGNLMQNIYVGNDEDFSSRQKAENYFVNVTNTVAAVMSTVPGAAQDPLLPAVYNSMMETCSVPQAMPKLSSNAVKRMDIAAPAGKRKLFGLIPWR